MNKSPLRPPAGPRLARALSIACLASAASCGGDAPAPGDDLPLSGVLITMDTTNAMALDLYGKDRGLTPRLKALAKDSVVFNQAHTVAPITLPAHTSMLTGLYPLRHGVRENGVMTLSQEAETLAERASEGGFDTAAFVSAAVLFSKYGLDQGFDIYDQPGEDERAGVLAIAERSSRGVTDRALTWLRGRDGERPFFLWVHYFDPHMPYSAPQEFVQRAQGSPYRAEVAAMDHDIGRLIDGLAKEVGLDRLTIAVVADHGEAFNAHGELTHSVYCYEATVHVPFLLRFADGRRAGTRSDELVSVVDLFPTFLDELGLGASQGVDGLSLAHGRLPDDRGVYVESFSGYLTYGWSPIAGWVDRSGKYLHSSVPEFYDLAKDPGEEHNLLEQGAADPAAYIRRIEELSRKPRLAAGGDVELNAEQIRELNALGYAAAGQETKELPDPLDPTGLPAPAGQAEVYAKSNQAVGMIGAGQYEQVIPLLREILEVNPEDINSLQNLGFALVSTGRFEEAIDPLERSIVRSSEHQISRVCLGLAYEKTGRFEQSLLQYRQAERLLPGGRGIAEAIARMQAKLDEQ